jgi:hypothetical protein
MCTELAQSCELGMTLRIAGDGPFLSQIWVDHEPALLCEWGRIAA